MVRNVVLLSSDKGIILSTHYTRSEQAPTQKNTGRQKIHVATTLACTPSTPLSSLTTTNIVADPPRPPLSTRSYSSKHLPYSWTRAKQNERGCPNRRSEIFFWEERTSKTRLVDLSGLPELKIVTSVNFLGQARSLLQNCGF